MDNSNMSKNRPSEYLGVNKIGKNIRKSPLHQPNFVNNNGSGSNNTPARQLPQPQVYNISKSDFRNIVQQLTGSPSRNDPLPRPTNHPPKNPSMRLQRIRPPPLTPINRPPTPPVVAAPAPMQTPLQGPPPMAPPPAAHSYNNFARPPAQFGQPSSRGLQPLGPGDHSGWMSPAVSPISAYMQQLQNCITDGSRRPPHPQMQPQVPGSVQGRLQVQPQAPVPAQFQAQLQSQPPVQSQFAGQGHAHGQPPSSGLLPNPSMPASGLLPNPSMPALPSPSMNGPALLPSPTSQFLLPSPSFFNMLSPTLRSPYPLLSPGTQFPPPLSPNFAFSPIAQSGILGPGPQLPLSPGIAFPPSPGFFSISSPRWREQ